MNLDPETEQRIEEPVAEEAVRETRLTPAQAVEKMHINLPVRGNRKLRRLMERQAIRRLERNLLTRDEAERVGEALMTLERTVHEIGGKFGLRPEELNLDLGPLGRLT